MGDNDGIELEHAVACQRICNLAVNAGIDEYSRRPIAYQNGIGLPHIEHSHRCGREKGPANKVHRKRARYSRAYDGYLPSACIQPCRVYHARCEVRQRRSRRSSHSDRCVGETSERLRPEHRYRSERIGRSKQNISEQTYYRCEGNRHEPYNKQRTHNGTQHEVRERSHDRARAEDRNRDGKRPPLGAQGKRQRLGNRPRHAKTEEQIREIAIEQLDEKDAHRRELESNIEHNPGVARNERHRRQGKSRDAVPAAFAP